MGKINQGILGGVSGKVGNVVGGNWKGIDYLRIMPASVANPKTPAQLDQRSKFVTVLKFLQAITQFLRIGYKNYAVKMTQFNSAMSEVLKNAVTGSYPNFEIDYSNVLVSKGSLPNAQDVNMTLDAEGDIQLSWTDNQGNGGAFADDTLMYVVYCPELKEAIFLNDGGASRSDQAQTIALPDTYISNDVHVFVSMISSDSRSISNSTYVGTLEA